MRNEDSNPSASHESKLAERLKAEALVERPTYSDALHDRIMQSVAAPHSPATIDRNARSRWSVACWVAVAAGLFVAALGVMQLGGSGDSRGPVEHPGNAASSIAIVEPAGKQISFDDLDHGAAAAVQLVVDQLPIEVPTVDWGAALVD